MTTAPARAWWGIFVPAGTADLIVRRLNAEFVRLFREPGFVEFLDSQLIEIAVGTPEEFTAFMKKDRDFAARLVKRYNVPVQ